MTTLRDVAIVGVHATEQARSLRHRSSFAIALEAATGAVNDAGLSLRDVDGVHLDWPGPGGYPLDSGSWARYLGKGVSLTTETMMDNAGPRGLLKAAAALGAGLCDVAVVGGGQTGLRDRWAGGPIGAGFGLEFNDVWGGYVVPMFALVAQRHMHEFGTTPAQLATVAATIRNNGSTNPEAVMAGKGPYTVDDVLASPLVASPFHLLDTCIAAEGGAAVVLTTVDRARDLRHPPVLVLSGGMEQRGAPYAEPPLYREVGRLGEGAVTRAFGLAGLTVPDVDVFALYDPNSFEVIRQLEVLGICAEGEGGSFVESEGIARSTAATRSTPTAGVFPTHGTAASK